MLVINNVWWITLSAFKQLKENKRKWSKWNEILQHIHIHSEILVFFFLSQITMVFTVSIQCYLGKKYKKRWTLYTSQCGFYYYQTFDSFFDPYIKSLTYKV